LEPWQDMMVGRGNCTKPNLCTCLCKEQAVFDADGEMLEGPWRDPLSRPIPPDYIFGRYDCLDGYEGVDSLSDGRFRSCHQRIYVPTYFQRNSVYLVSVVGSALGLLVIAVCTARCIVRCRELRMRRKRLSERRAMRDKET
jgi:hypothetical protein